jgi:hypothetical protein
MNPGDVAPMIVMVTGILTAGGVIILRPIAKHLAEYLRTLNEQSRLGTGAATSAAEIAYLRDSLSAAESRLALLEERQNFTENLLTSRREQQALPGDRIRTV